MDVPSTTSRQNAPAQIKPLLNVYPVPTGPNRIVNGVPNGLAEFAASFSNPATFDAASIRVDHTVSDKLNLFGRYNHAPSETFNRNGSNTTSIQFKTKTLTGGATWLLSSRISNEFRLNYSRTRE